MSGGKQPDNSAEIAALQKQREQAQAQADKLAQNNLDETNTLRRRRGASLLNATSELGVQQPIGT